MVRQRPVAWITCAALYLGLALGCTPGPKPKNAAIQVLVNADAQAMKPRHVAEMSENAAENSPQTRDIAQQTDKPRQGSGVQGNAEPEASEAIVKPVENAESAPDKKTLAAPKCTKQGEALKVYAVGSSTMAGLAFVMRKPLKKRGVDFESGAKPSSGLSRPDFFDWPAEIPKVVKRVDPDVFVVSMGTNDNQAVRLADRSWIRPNEPQWEEVYRGRVRAMLKGMSEGRSRRIIWIGPNSVHGRKKGSRRYRINEMMRDEVMRFEGDAHYIDLYRLITHEKSGRVRRLIQRKSDGRYFKARAKDGVHLSLPALRFMLAEQVYEVLEPCLSAASLKRRHAIPSNRTPRRPIDSVKPQTFAKR